MIRFSQRLQDVLAFTGWTQRELAQRAGVSATNVSRWLRCHALPDRQALGKVVDVVPEKEAARLMAAWAYDALPQQADRLLTIAPKKTSMSVEETRDEWPVGLNQASRRKFIDFSRIAMNHRDVMDIVDVLHTAAMRAESRGAGGK